MSIIDDPETLAIFLEDSQEHLDGIENDLLVMEEDGENINVGLVNKVFRAIHSIKGGAGFLGLETLKELAHGMENILNMIRNLELVPTGANISTLLNGADVLKGMISNAESSNDVDISDQIAALQGCICVALPEQQQPDLNTMVPFVLPDGREIFSVSSFDLDQARKGGKMIYLLTFDLIADIHNKGRTPLDVMHELQQTGMFIESKVEVEAVGQLTPESETERIPFFVLYATLLDAGMICTWLNIDASQVRFIPSAEDEGTGEPATIPETSAPSPSVRLEAVPDSPAQAPPLPPAAPTPVDIAPPEPVAQAPLPPPASVPAPSPAPSRAAAASPKEPQDGKTSMGEGSLRVSVKILDVLMNLAGELVLTRNQLVQAVTTGDYAARVTAAQRIDLVTSELQEAIMSTRMQSIGNVFNKFSRVVRDMARDLGKEVTLQVTGEEVELDKTIIESIGDPLTHLVRNAMDHGIEVPEVRRQAGKAPTATLKLSARHEAGKVIIEVDDDGAGIDPLKIKAKALSLGLYEPAQLDAMSDEELVQLIFLPGFSTAQEVTDISGRGVGMDVVHTNLTKLGGTIDIHSQVGLGTVLSIKLPLTLAIVPSLLVAVDDERYAIPQVNLVELVRVPASQLCNRIEHIGTALVMRLRGELLPLIHLREVLGIQTAPLANDPVAPEDSSTAEGERAMNIAVVAAGNLHYGIIVNQLLDSEEIVVKPLGQHLQDSKIYAGATIQGDGRIALILDVVGISTMMQLAKIGETTRNDTLNVSAAQQKGTDAQSLLLVKNASHEQFAIPLTLVSRIERVHKRDIELAGGRRNIKYRGGNLLLLCIEDAANVSPCDDREDLAAVVFAIGGKEVGLLVSQILEVIDTDVAIDAVTFRQTGILGSAIILDETTLLLDIYDIVATVLHDSMTSPTVVEKGGAGDPYTILVVEDSNFFLQHVRGFIEESGYAVVTAQDGLQALEQLEQCGDKIDLVLTDIEMPNLDGLGLTQRIRDEPRFAHLPVIALTSGAGEAAEQRGKAAGIDDYLVKLDKDRVLERVAYHLTHRHAA